jgi:hypothetical protein
MRGRFVQKWSNGGWLAVISRRFARSGVRARLVRDGLALGRKTKWLPLRLTNVMVKWQRPALPLSLGLVCSKDRE